MKTTKLIFIISIVLLSLSCNKQLPESYGIYLISGDELKTIEPQKLQFKGNLFSSVSGLKDIAGINPKTVEELIVFEKDADPKKIILTRLKFQDGCEVQDLFSKSYMELKLWTADNDITIKIAPVDGKTDMYRIIPVDPLQNGYYALHFGELKNKETLSAADKFVYSFVVGTVVNPNHTNGNNNQPQSAQQIQAIDTSTVVTDNTVVASEEVIGKDDFYASSKALLDKANGFFNSRNYVELRKIYINTDGSIIQEADWNKLVDGFKNWSLQSGKIISSTISEYNYELNKGSFKLKTRYEKTGVINEDLTVIYKDKSYYITFIGTK